MININLRGSKILFVFSNNWYWWCGLKKNRNRQKKTRLGKLKLKIIT